MKKRLLAIAGASAVALVAGAVLAATQPWAATAGTPPESLVSPAQMAQATRDLTPVQDELRAVAREVTPAVVEINVSQLITEKIPVMDSPFGWFFGQQPGAERSQTFRRSGLGSGIMVRRTADRVFVLTNYHVVKGATDISVRLDDQRVFKAKVVGSDPQRDMALIEFATRRSVPLASLGDSNTLEVGDFVLAVGNPLGFESTVTMGVVSALGRHGPAGETAPRTTYIQTDAAINPGNSGGALVNIQGQVIGINTWIAAPSGGNVGLGFAIPINNVKRDIDALVARGKA